MGQRLGYLPRTALHVPETCDRLAKGPISFRTHRFVNRGFHDWHAAEFFAKHEFERNEDTMVQAWSLESPSIATTGFVLCSQTGANTGLQKRKWSERAAEVVPRRNCGDEAGVHTFWNSSTTRLESVVSPRELNLTL